MKKTKSPDAEEVTCDVVKLFWKLEAKQIWTDPTVIGGRRESVDELYFSTSHDEAYAYIGKLISNVASGYTFMLFPKEVETMDIKFTVRGKKSGKLFIVDGNKHFDEENS